MHNPLPDPFTKTLHEAQDGSYQRFELGGERAFESTIDQDDRGMTLKFGYVAQNEGQGFRRKFARRLNLKIG
jgi:hypothetical protein